MLDAALSICVLLQLGLSHCLSGLVKLEGFAGTWCAMVTCLRQAAELCKYRQAEQREDP
jgi:hypothetical protein